MTTTSPKGQLTKIGTPVGEPGSVTPSNSQGAATVQEWREDRQQMKSAISQLTEQQEKRRSAELVAILEVSSSKIDRFGWGSMDKNVKRALCDDWCDRLEQYELQEVRDGVAKVFEDAKGKLRSINEFQVQEAIMAQHARDLAALPKVHKELTPTPEQTDEEKARIDELVKNAFPTNR